MLRIHVSEGTAEGWFGPGKKSAIMSIAVLATLILGVFFGIFAAVSARGGIQGVFKSGEENTPGPFTGPQSAGSVPEIKYVPVAEAKGLEVEPKVIVEDWKQGILSASVKIKNTRGEMLVTAKLTVTMFGQSGARGRTSSFSVNRLKPGETVPLDLRSLEVSNVSSIKRVEISFDTKNLIWETAPASTPSPSTTPSVARPSTTPTATTPAAQGNTFTAAPQNPQTPSEVVAAFYFLIDSKDFLGAARLTRGVDKTNEKEAAAKLEKEMVTEGQKVYKPGQLQKVEVVAKERISQGFSIADIHVTLYFKNGAKAEPTLNTIKENGTWRVA